MYKRQIYGSHKGVTAAQKESLDQDMAHFADVTETTLNCAYKNYPGAGAAGGLGFAFLSYLHASLSPGVELILDAINLSDALNGADIVVTGEGQLDRQTAMGKAPVGVAKLAKAHGAKVLAFSGSVKMCIRDRLNMVRNLAYINRTQCLNPLYNGNRGNKPPLII